MDHSKVKFTLVQSLTIDKNGKIRPCVDYRALNSKTLKDAYPIKSVQENLDAMAEAALFSTFDLTSGYHQIPVSPLDIHKTAFFFLFFLQNMVFMNFVQYHLGSVTVQPHAKDYWSWCSRGYNGRFALYT